MCRAAQCDGDTDCPDGSDEAASECGNLPSPCCHVLLLKHLNNALMGEVKILS